MSSGNNIYPIIAFSIVLFLTDCSSYQMSGSNNPLPKCPSAPNCKRVALVFDTDSNSVFNAFEKALSKMNAETFSIKPEESRIDAVFKIPLFGYRDDVAVIIKSDGNSSQTFIRSASREGNWDIWVNSIRVNRLIKNVKKNLKK